MKKTINLSWYIALAFALVLPWLFPNDYTRHLLVMAMLAAVTVSSLNLIHGMTGQLSLGHAAFYGIGAYTSALLVMRLGVPFWLAFLGAIALGGLTGLLVGLPVLHLRGHFFAVATLGFGEIINLVLTNSVGLTRGPMGLPGIPAPKAIGPLDFTNRVIYYYLVVLVLAIVVVISLRIQDSKFGRALLAIKADDVAASAMGINVFYFRVLAFVISTGVAGAAGSLYAHYALFISPITFSTTDSVNLVVMLLVGGTGSVPGAVTGAVLLTFLSEWLRQVREYQMVIYGLLVLGVIIFVPGGMAGLAAKWLPALERRLKGGKRGDVAPSQR
ncbi:MAG TPA: branched-chain amino acid ABC transporter permease [Symbiobacteriaceae bacterium]|jgi:branched-chain amino acid transport system permease protein